jgi:hypothetical protein
MMLTNSTLAAPQIHPWETKRGCQRGWWDSHLISCRVPVFHLSREHDGTGLKPSVGMAGKPCKGLAGRQAKLVQHQIRVQISERGCSNSARDSNPRTFHRLLALDHLYTQHARQFARGEKTVITYTSLQPRWASETQKRVMAHGCQHTHLSSANNAILSHDQKRKVV